MARHPILSDEEILRRARPVFVERGYAVRTREVAAAVGLSWPALVLRFGGKLALFRRAISDPVRRPFEAGSTAEGTDLREMLERLRSQLSEQWPMQLQCRLAMGPAEGHSSDALTDWLSSTLATQAGRGAVRSDLPAGALAQMVGALLVGDVAQRFIRGEKTPACDPAFIARLMQLLQPGDRNHATEREPACGCRRALSAIAS
jgi:AcrR family transcriptional regulator